MSSDDPSFSPLQWWMAAPKTLVLDAFPIGRCTDPIEVPWLCPSTARRGALACLCACVYAAECTWMVRDEDAYAAKKISLALKRRVTDEPKWPRFVRVGMPSSAARPSKVQLSIHSIL